MIHLLLTLFLLGPAGASAEGTFQSKLAFQVRELFNIPPGVPVRVEEPAPSDLPGFKKAKLTVGEGAQESVRFVYVTEDKAKWFMADVHSLGENPDAARAKAITVDGPARGKKGAPITVVEYSDIQCPYCKKAHQGLKKDLLDAFPGKIQWIYKHYPLTNIHPWAEKAAVSVECARKQGDEKYWSLLDLYYDNQETVTPINLREKTLEFAKQAKINAGPFTTCFDNMETLGTVRKHVEEGDKIGVESTPSIFVNGHLFRGFRDFAPFKAVIDEMLAGKHQP